MGGWLRPGAFAAVLTVLLAGCFPFGPMFPDPIGEPIPTFCEGGGSGPPMELTHDSATVVLSGGETSRIELGPNLGGSRSMAINDPCGPYIAGAWSDPKGDFVLSVEYPALEAMGMPSPSGDPGQQVAINIQQPNQRPPLIFYDAPDDGAGGVLPVLHYCTVTLAEHSVAGLVGHADCPGVWWHSETEADMFGPPPSGTPTFDLSIDFSALP